MSPVWERLSAGLDPAASLLVVVGPRGSGRLRFARSWLGPEGQLVDYSRMPPGTTPPAAVEKVLETRREHPCTRIAAVLPPTSEVYELAQLPDAQLVRGPDLFLTLSEVESLSVDFALSADTAADSGREAVPGLSPERLWRLTGGWLHGVQTLLADPAAEMEVARDVGRAIAPWASQVDPGGFLHEAAFLPLFSEDILQAFYAERTDLAPSLAQLAEACLIFRTAEGEWTMPDLARTGLQASIQRRNPGRAQELDAWAVAALADISEPGAAVVAAVERRTWRGLWSVLEEHWVDLFMSNPRILRYAALKMPARMARGELFTVALKILTAAGKDRMILPFPTTEPNYAQDRTAQNLRKLVQEYSRRPNSMAITAGLVELGFLRIQGHYEISGHCGARLRRTVSQAAAADRVRPVLAGMAELHSGMSLHIADRLNEAASAYEAAMHWGASVDHPFIQANAAANLALVNAQAGNTQTAREWVDKAEAFLVRTTWGTKMVGRGAQLARIYIAWHELDRQKMDAGLALLPDEPDSDEFWPLHAELLTLRDRFFGSPDAGLHRINNLRNARPYASMSPLALRSLGHAEIAARVALDPLAAPRTLPADAPELRNVQAYLAIQTGNTDAALAGLHRTLTGKEGGWRIRCLARNLQLLAAAVPGPLGAEALETVRANYQTGGELVDLLWLWQDQQNQDGLRKILGLTKEETGRLDSFASRRGRAEDRSSLTERELEVLAGLRLGKTRTEMAEERHVSVNTVKAQTSSLYRKLGASTRNEALRKAKLWGY